MMEFRCTAVNSASNTELQRLSEIFDLVGMRARNIDDLSSAIQASTVVFVARTEDQIVGIGRLISDEVYYGSIWDVAVHLEFQKNGFGTLLVSSLLECADQLGLYLVGLVTAIPNRIFYQNTGFEFLTDVFAMRRRSGRK
jgi:GNAT superfamily N-acetyltransferase